MLVAMLGIGACSDVGGGAPEQEGSLDLTAEISAQHPLRGDITFSTTTDDTRPRVEIVSPSGHGVAVTPIDAVAGEQAVPILGARPDTTYTVTVTADGTTQSTEVTTGSLPGDLPPVEVEVEAEADAMSPGLTLFDAVPINGNGANDGHLLAVDPAGEIVWYYRQAHSIQDSRRTSAGDILFINHEVGARQLDPLTDDFVEFSGVTGLETAPEDEQGRKYVGPDAIRVDTDQMHHEVAELPNGNLVTLSREVRTVEGFPDDLCEEGDDFDGSYEVGADTVVEFSPETGEVVHEWSLFDYVDPLESLDVLSAGSFCGTYLDPVYPDMSARDWTHANGVVLDEARNVLWVSVRHLNQLLAIRYADDDAGTAGELVWKLGEGGDFDLTEGEWFLYQHAPQVLPDGTLMIYDNGNGRAGTSFDDPAEYPYSRAVQYELDTDAMTARQVWESRLDTPDSPVYAPFVGDADMLDGGTVLVTHGGQTDPPADSPRAEGVTVWGRIVEVDYDSGDVVFDLRVRDDGGEGWRIYRSERIPTLYPDGYEVETISP